MHSEEQPQRRRSKNEVFIYITWAVRSREPLIVPAIERSMHRCIVNVAEEAGYTVLTINGMADHIHIVVKDTPKLARSEAMKRIKGISSALANDLPSMTTRFRWQEGYAAYSISYGNLPIAIGYVENQKKHHATGTIISNWEEIDEAADQ